eukprot:2493184-Amphidinium_carterae.1
MMWTILGKWIDMTGGLVKDINAAAERHIENQTSTWSITSLTYFQISRALDHLNDFLQTWHSQKLRARSRAQGRRFNSPSGEALLIPACN